jgi:hypothetical protein
MMYVDEESLTCVALQDSLKSLVKFKCPHICEVFILHHTTDAFFIIQPLGAAAIVGAYSAVAGVPAVLGAVGFTGAGITAGSIASSMMSAFATASGGGVAAGGIVATLQSIGAAGLGCGGIAVVGVAGAAVGAVGAVAICK